MSRNSCAMIIFLYFMDDISMDYMARGYNWYSSGVLTLVSGRPGEL